ncbi:MAG: SDR family oxidoreductase [Arsenophonus sp.]|nr:MAG: SDR family oxidoreductase [Arsenophonus sp.]
MNIVNKKKILITGLSNKYSISFGIANCLYKYGAKLAFTYQNEKIKNKILKIAQDFNSDIVLPCDVSSDESIQNLFIQLKKKWKTFDGFIHSIAYAPTEELKDDYINTVTRKGFIISHSISSYSLVALAKFCRNMLNPYSSIVTLTYLGAERVVPNYNVMGPAKASLEANVKYMANYMGEKNIRVNGISSGPIKTLASSRIKNFRKMLSFYKNVTPLKIIINSEDIGNCATFLCSDLSKGITGEIIHVDGGFHITTMNLLE